MSERSIVVIGSLCGRAEIGLLPDSSCSARGADLPRYGAGALVGTALFFTGAYGALVGTATRLAAAYGVTALAGSAVSGWCPGSAGVSSSCVAGALLALAARAAPSAAAMASLLVAFLAFPSTERELTARSGWVISTSSACAASSGCVSDGSGPARATSLGRIAALTFT